MTETATRILNKVAWVDLAAKDAAAARDFYGKVLGWTTEVNPDPQYGGYGRARVDGKDVAGIGPAQSPDQPSAWSVYIGTDDLDALSKRITDAGGTVIAPGVRRRRPGPDGGLPRPVRRLHLVLGSAPDGRLPDRRARRVRLGGPERPERRGAIPFYATVFGWTPKPTGTPDRPYTEFQVDGTEHRRRDGDGPDGAGRGAELLDGLLQRRRRGCHPSHRRRRGRARARPADSTSRAAGCRSSATRKVPRSGS